MDTARIPRPVVVGYDHSDCSLAALTWAGQLAESTGAPVKVVHASEAIVHAQDVAFGLLNPTSEHEFAQRVAREGADQLSARYPSLEVEASGSILSARVALDEASTRASMIVIGSHGRGRFGSMMLGSTAYALSGHARCPVIVVRDGEAPLPGPRRPVVVGSDGSVSASRAADVAADLAGHWRAPLLVVSSWMPPPPDPWDHPPFGYPSVSACLEAREAKARKTNLDVLEHIRTRHHDVEAEGRVVEARPEDAIANASPDAAMLILGSRGHSTLMGALLGSTARAVLHHSTMPVMIVH
ncbi:MAG: universal stress protein [Ornithinimicrobium sp.]